MEIVRLYCPFSVATILWEERPGVYQLTIGVKATFTLVHDGVARLAPRQDTAHGDISWDHNPQAALFAPSDFVPRKPKIDVAFSGRAFAPGGVPTDVLVPRLRVGSFEKSLRVLGPRVWMHNGTGLRASAPERFVAAPLRYELAAMQGENLSGIPFGSGCVGWPLPRIETTEACGPNATPGFGPLPIRWRAEQRGVPEEAITFARRLRTEQACAPEALRYSLFNCAPSEQQLDELEPAPVIVLEHLTRKIPRFETRLPNIRPRAFYAPHGASKPFEVELALDTIWIDGVRLVAVATWRGTTRVGEPDEQALGRIIVASESPEMTVSLEDVESSQLAPEDSVPAPILPRPFEGEIAEDEGYTLLPTKPVQRASEELPARLPSPQRDSSVPIPPSGERLIEARASMFVVDGALPGPNELVERAAHAHAEDERPPSADLPFDVGGSAGTSLALPPNPPFILAGAARTPPDLPELTSLTSWQADVWEADAAPRRAPMHPIPTNAPLPDLAEEAEEDPADAAPATARTGTTSPPPDDPYATTTEPAPPTLVPSTRKTGSIAPPTLPGSTMPVGATSDRRMFELSPTTQRAPAVSSWSEPKGYLPTTPAPTTTTPPLSPTESAAFFSSTSMPSAGPVAPSAPVTPPPRPSVVSVETPRPSAERRRPSTSGMIAPTIAGSELPLELCAAVAARIDRCPEARARVLAEVGLSEQRWATTEQTWIGAIRAETEQGRGELRLAFDRAYVQELERERGSVEIADYARLMFAVEHSDVDVVLVELGMPRACLVRIERVWQERMAADLAFRARVREALVTARRALSRLSSDGRTYAEATPSRPRSSDR